MEMVRKSHESMACAMPRPGAILCHDLLMSSMLVYILVLPTCRTILTLEELRCHAQNNDPTNCSRVPLKNIATYYWGTQAQQASISTWPYKAIMLRRVRPLICRTCG
jgi:hypothetical protein